MVKLYMPARGRLRELATFICLPFIVTMIVFPMTVYKIWAHCKMAIQASLPELEPVYFCTGIQYLLAF